MINIPTSNFEEPELEAGVPSNSTGVAVGEGVSVDGNEIEGVAWVITAIGVGVEGGRTVVVAGAGCVAAFFTSNSCP